MADRSRARRSGARWSVLPGLVEHAPPYVLLAIGIGVGVLGLLIVVRPLTSLLLLGVYVGLSAIVSGVLELADAHRTPRWWTRVFAAAWIAGGVAVLIWLGRSLNLLPAALAVLLIIGGLASLGEAAARGSASQRILAAASGLAQMVFGILALTWPDVTVLVVAVVFGVRTVVLGVSLVIRGGRALAAGRDRTPGPDEPSATTGRTGRRLAVARSAAAVVLVAVTAGGWWVNGWLAAGAPVIDRFYDPPEDVPATHGELLRADVYQGRYPDGGQVRRMLYTTRDALGGAAVGSGLVIVPTDAPAGPRPVIVWNHGTTGVARGCAPSLRDDAATEWAIPALEDALARGWVVVAPDYSGQGAPGVFPYLIGRGEGRSALDAVLAAEAVDGVDISDEVVLWGHSQGGHAALWAGAIAADYTPELDIRGTAALAPAADPLALAEEFTAGRGGFELSLLTSWVLVPYADTYADVDIDDYVASGARSIVREMTQRCPTEPGVVVSVATALGVSEDRPLYAADLTSGALGRRLEQNIPTGPWEAPLLIAWGTADEVIPPALQDEFVAGLCAQGQQVRWASYDGITHQRILQPPSPFLPALMRWTAARLDQQDAGTSDCPG